MLPRVASRPPRLRRASPRRPPPPRGRPFAASPYPPGTTLRAPTTASGEKPAGDETVLDHLLSDETSTDADDDAPRVADHPDDHPAHLDESRGVTVEAGEDLDDDDDEDLDEDDASVSAAAAELDAALAASALARSSGPIRWYGGVEPHRPSAAGARPDRVFPWTRPRAAPALDVLHHRFWRLSETTPRDSSRTLPRAIADEFAASNTGQLLFGVAISCSVPVARKSILARGVGAGKSVALAHIVAWARSEGYASRTFLGTRAHRRFVVSEG